MAKRTKNAKGNSAVGTARTASYKHPEATTPLRPEVGTQPQFKKKKPPATYRYDSSLSPALEWDGQNAARDMGAWLIRCIEEYAAAMQTGGAGISPAQDGQDARTTQTHRQDAGATKVFKNGRGEVVATVCSLADAVEQLKRIEKPFLNWAGKAERLSFDVPTLPLFVHERLSTKAILETLKAHKRDKQMTMFDLFGDPQHPVADQVLKAYEHQDKWQNRLVLGDSLVVMNSLLRYEGLGGQVQMIYMDPPYGIKYGSNFQPFVRKRDVKHNDDEDMTREPEMVKAYRDTWELGLHSYLTYLRDRLLLARDLLNSGGSLFLQISDDNVHYAHELLEEVFGAENFMSLISFRTKIPLNPKHLAKVADYVIWFAKSKKHVRFRRVFGPREMGADTQFNMVRLEDGSTRKMTAEELARPALLPKGSRAFRLIDLTASGYTESCHFEFELNGKKYAPPKRTNSWKTSPEGMRRLIEVGRIMVQGSVPGYVFYFDDYPVVELTNQWVDTQGAVGKAYAVQTATKVVERCMLMTTDPGDLVLDPTCGSGTTAYVAEQWGRRWITTDTSRVPLALARQRLLTATFDYYELNDEARGPAGGFVYKRRQNKKGEEVGGIVPHVTLGSIANNEPPDEEVLVDRPEKVGKITRITGPFVVEATIPTPIDMEESREREGAGPLADARGSDHGRGGGQDHGTFVERMIEVLRRSPVLHVGGNKTVSLRSIRPPAKTLSLSAEALVVNGNGNQSRDREGAGSAARASDSKKPLPDGRGSDQGKPVAIVFGPENGAVSEKSVYEAAREAHAKSYAHLYVIGFAIQPNARKLVDECEKAIGVPATYVQATPDLMMGDLLKNMRSSQIFSVCGLPEVKLRKADTDELKKLGLDPKEASRNGWYQAELLGLDVFDPATMEVDHRPGGDVPCWMLDGDYNGLCFKASQVFFPRTAAWDDLKRALRAEYAESVWDHLAGTTSAPFQMGESGQIAVKVIDDRGNELLVVKKASEVEK